MSKVNTPVSPLLCEHEARVWTNEVIATDPPTLSWHCTACGLHGHHSRGREWTDCDCHKLLNDHVFAHYAAWRSLTSLDWWMESHTRQDVSQDEEGQADAERVPGTRIDDAQDKQDYGDDGTK